jgi:hypothetical protein
LQSRLKAFLSLGKIGTKIGTWKRKSKCLNQYNSLKKRTFSGHSSVGRASAYEENLKPYRRLPRNAFVYENPKIPYRPLPAFAGKNRHINRHMKNPPPKAVPTPSE